MSISNGVDANATNFNASFVSKTANDTKTGTLTLSDVTDSSSKDTGALVLEGGLGVEKNVNVGGQATVVGDLLTQGALTAALDSQFDASVNIDVDLTVGNDITATGAITGSNLSGTNTGDVVLAPVGSSPNANGASLTGQTLNLQPADATNPGVVSTGAQSIAGTKTFTGDVVVAGDLTVNGTTTTLNTATLDVEDTNITVNNGGNDVSAEGAGLTVERTGTNGSLIYQDSLASKFKAGAAASESEIITASTTQTMTGVKTFDTAPVIKEIATPSTPATGYQKIYPKSDGKFYHLDDGGIETELGSGGGGGGGIQFLSGDDFDFEATVGNWLAYADAAGTSPVDGTGGSPTVTMTRTTSSPLHDVGSGLLTKDAANRQGEGVSVAFTLPTGYQNKRGSVIFPYAIASGTYTAAAVKVFVYDVTNSKFLQTFNNEILGTSGIIQMAVDFENGSSHRLILHISGTDANAYTLKFDDVQVTPQDAVFGAPVSDGTDYTPTFQGFGTPSSISAKYYRVGKQMRVLAKWTNGTNTATEARIYLPTGLTIGGQPSSGIHIVGRVVQGSNFAYNNQAVLAENGNTFVNFGVLSSGTAAGVAPTTKRDGNNFTDSVGMQVDFTVPIAEWSSNITMSNSSGYWISSISSTAGRVTGSAPTQLGQYRSYLRNAAASTYTETNGSPGTSPGYTNGFLIYGGNGFASADSNNEPSRYEIFVGKNKVIFPRFFSTTGRTGNAYNDVFFAAATSVVGTFVNYDATTGIVIIQVAQPSGATASSDAALSDSFGSVHDAYFDIFVSENALAVGLSVPNSEVFVDTGNGRGSTNTAIRRFSNTRSQVGAAITYADSSTDGASFTINENGIYSINYHDGLTDSSAALAISVNSSALTTGALSLTYAQGRRAVSQTSAAGSTDSAHTTLRLQKGDIVRAVIAGGTPSTDDDVYFHIIKISD